MNELLITVLAAYMAFLWFLPRYRANAQAEIIKLKEQEILHLNKEIKEKKEALEKLQSSQDRLVKIFFGAKLDEWDKT